MDAKSDKCNPPKWEPIRAQKFVLSILSTIFFARGAFPADCFRTVSERELDDLTITHEILIGRGAALHSSHTVWESVLSQNRPQLYFRQSGDNLRLNTFLKSLNGDGGTLNAIQQQRLAIIQICFSASKTWDRSEDIEALIEFYTLKCRYAPDGSLHLYIDWGGTPNHPIPARCNHNLNEFFRTQPPISGISYVHYCVFGTDRKPLEYGLKSGLRQSIRRAVAILDEKPASSSGRIDKLVCPVRSSADAQKYESNFGARLSVSGGSIPAPSVSDIFDPTLWAESSSPVPSSAKRQLRQEEGEGLKLQLEYSLSVIEQASDELQATQPLSTQGSSQRRMSSGKFNEMLQNFKNKSRQRPILFVESGDVDGSQTPVTRSSGKRPMYLEISDDEEPQQPNKQFRRAFLKPLHASDRQDLSQSSSTRRFIGRVPRFSSGNTISTRLDASQIGSPSSTVSP